MKKSDIIKKLIEKGIEFDKTSLKEDLEKLLVEEVVAEVVDFDYTGIRMIANRFVIIETGNAYKTLNEAAAENYKLKNGGK